MSWLQGVMIRQGNERIVISLKIQNMLPYYEDKKGNDFTSITWERERTQKEW